MGYFEPTLPPTNSHQRQPLQTTANNNNNSEKWESFRIGSKNDNQDSKKNGVPPHSMGSYFPVENIRPLKSSESSPKKSDEADSGKLNFGSNIRRNDERVDLDTKYFQITEKNDVGPLLSLSSTSKPPSRGPILVINFLFIFRL